MATELPLAIERARGGDAQAFGELVRSHAGLVYGIARRMVGDPDTAQDVSQEAFVKAWLNIGLLRENSSFTAWIASIARRAALDHIRRRKPEDPTGEEIDEFGVDPGIRAEGGSILETAILELPERDRMLLTLFYFGDLKNSEIAEATGIPEGNVRVYVHRARRRLRTLLEGREDEVLQQV